MLARQTFLLNDAKKSLPLRQALAQIAPKKLRQGDHGHRRGLGAENAPAQMNGFETVGSRKPASVTLKPPSGPTASEAGWTRDFAHALDTAIVALFFPK
jgi:hypothetical protein